MRKWIGQRGWRRLHYASFLAFVLSVGHALVVGTDLHGVGGPILAAIVLGPTLWLVLMRVLAPSPKPQLRPAAALASTPSGS
jgi:DMSO/TMAO reductase YedYZ heme-binding membrane subunit